MNDADPILVFIYFMALVVIIFIFTSERKHKGF